MFLGLSEEARQRLEYEVISNEARLRLTRLLREAAGRDDQDVVIVRQNTIVNIARNVLHLPLYILESDDMGSYSPAEHGWHRGEIEILSRRPDTARLVETLADLIQQHWLDLVEVNDILAQDGVAVVFESVGFDDDIHVVVPSVEEIEDEKDDEHPNVRVLVQRMDTALENGDAPAVLHASASIFETLAKDVVADVAIQDKSLGQFFDKYAANSHLPQTLLHYIREVFRHRNKEPLAGHGNLAEPTITVEDAVVLANLTKAIVRIERQLAFAKPD